MANGPQIKRNHYEATYEQLRVMMGTLIAGTIVGIIAFIAGLIYQPADWQRPDPSGKEDAENPPRRYKGRKSRFNIVKKESAAGTHHELDSLSGSGTEGQASREGSRGASRGQRHRQEARLEEVDDERRDKDRHKASGKVIDALCEPDDISWRNEQSDEGEGKEAPTAARPNERDHAAAIKLHNDLKLVGAVPQKQVSFNSSLGNSATKLFNESVQVSPPKKPARDKRGQQNDRGKPPLVD